MPEVMSVAVGKLQFSLRGWRAVDNDKAPTVLLHATGKTARDWDVTRRAFLLCGRCMPST